MIENNNTPPQNTPPAPDPKPGQEGYEAFIVQKTQERLAAERPQRPEHVPEKFWNSQTGTADYESLAKSYAELEKKLGAPKPPEQQTTPPAATPPETPPATKPEDKGVFAGLDRAKYAQEVAGGGLSEASYAELAAKGFDAATVNAYISGQQAMQAAQRNELLTTVGGPESFEAMKTWAATALSADDIARFDKQVVANKDSATLALQWLQAQYQAANGKAPRVQVAGSSSGATSSTGFSSQAEAVAAVRDPRYQRDPAYRAKVAQKLANKTY